MALRVVIYFAREGSRAQIDFNPARQVDSLSLQWLRFGILCVCCLLVRACGSPAVRTRRCRLRFCGLQYLSKGSRTRGSHQAWASPGDWCKSAQWRKTVQLFKLVQQPAQTQATRSNPGTQMQTHFPRYCEVVSCVPCNGSTTCFEA